MKTNFAVGNNNGVTSDGKATITFTATDSGGLRDSETMPVDVITAIRIRVKVFLEGSLQ